MKRIAFALMLLPLTAWAGPGTGTFEEGGLRWYRDHSPAEVRRLHLSKNYGTDSSPDIWAKSEGHCAARVKIESPAFHPSWSVVKVTDYLRWASWDLFEEDHYLMRHWEAVKYYKLDRYKINWRDKDWGLKTKFYTTERHEPFPWDWVPYLKGTTYDDHAFGGHSPDGSKSKERWDDLLAQFKRAMDDEEHVHYAYWEGNQSFDIDTFHSAKIGKTDKWADNGIWRHKVQLKSCGGFWTQDYKLDTVGWRTTDFDWAIIHIDETFNRNAACRNKGGWDATYLARHSDGRIHVTHRCNGKRSDGHFARGERKLSVTDSRRLANLLSKSVDHF